MRNKRLVCSLILFISLYLLLAPTCQVQAQENEVKDAGQLLLIAANKRIDQNNCRSLRRALQLIEEYQTLRTNHPEAGLADRSSAINELTDKIKNRCPNNQGNTGATSDLVLLPGGVRCATCMPSEGEGVTIGLSRPINTPTCSRCSEIDLVTLAVIYMDQYSREKFLEKLAPEIREALRNKIQQSIEVVREINESVNRERTPLSRPDSTVVPVLVTPPGRDSTPTSNPISKPPGVSPLGAPRPEVILPGNPNTTFPSGRP